MALPADTSVWVNKDRSVIIGLYVDDLLMAFKTTKLLHKIKNALKNHFNVTNTETASLILGMEIIRDRSAGVIQLSQAHYVQQMLDDASFAIGYAYTTPLDGYLGLSPTGENNTAVEPRPYQRLMGRLNWLVTGTRPDIAFAVHKLSQHNHAPGESHMKVIQHVYSYLSYIQHYLLTYTRHTNHIFRGYSDANFASDESTRKSTSGYVFYHGQSAITWQSKH
jgi:Reverse transcriptase (RNA-dependent DNA polymerase)